MAGLTPVRESSPHGVAVTVEGDTGLKLRNDVCDIDLRKACAVPIPPTLDESIILSVS